jgi:hypothetical protein
MPLKQMVVKNINIDKLIDILMEIRKETEYIDIKAEEDNIIKIKASPFKPKDKDDLTDLNQIIA